MKGFFKSTSTMSALAPGARRPMSSRPSAAAPPAVAARNTAAAGGVPTFSAKAPAAEAAARERRRARRGGCADVRQQGRVFAAVPVQPRVFIYEDRMAENGARSEDADLFRPLDRRLAVAPHHFMEFVHALRAMCSEW